MARLIYDRNRNFGPIRDWHYANPSLRTPDFDICNFNVTDPNVDYVVQLAESEYEDSREHTLQLVAHALGSIVTPWLADYRPLTRD